MNVTIARPSNGCGPTSAEDRMCDGYWLDLSFQAVVVGVTSTGAVVSAVMLVALLVCRAPADCVSSRLLAIIFTSALALCVASLVNPAMQLGGKDPGSVECVFLGSVYQSAVQTTAFALACLNVEQYMLVLHCSSRHRKWMSTLFTVAPWALSWALTIPHTVEYWGCFRPSSFASLCTLCGPRSTRLVNGLVTVLLPVGVTAFVYVRLMTHVMLVRNGSPQHSPETSMPRFIQATCSKSSNQKLERDLSSMVFVLSLVCTFYMGYLPYVIIESYLQPDVGCLGYRLAFLWWTGLGCWGPFFNLLRCSRYRSACRSAWFGRSLSNPDAKGEEFGM